MAVGRYLLINKTKAKMKKYVVMENDSEYINSEGDWVKDMSSARQFTDEEAQEYINTQQMWRDWAKAPHRNLKAIPC